LFCVTIRRGTRQVGPLIRMPEVAGKREDQLPPAKLTPVVDAALRPRPGRITIADPVPLPVGRSLNHSSKMVMRGHHDAPPNRGGLRARARHTRGRDLTPIMIRS